MFGWIAAGVAVALGWVVTRAWRHDAAIKSGEVMDVRNLLPDGQGDCLARVLGERLYRVELQIEARHVADAAAVLPLRLTVTRVSDVGDAEVVYDGMRSLVALAHLGTGHEKRGDGSTHFWGSLPLLELTSTSIVRLRFEASAPTMEALDGREIASVDKASLVVKENVRPWVASSALVDRVDLEGSYRP